jgi:Fic family protein
MNRTELKKLPIKIDYAGIIPYLSRANYSLGRLDALFKFLPNPNLLVAPLLVKEATLSSRIENTQSSITDVYLYQAGEKTKFEDVKEIVNYRQALEHARNVLKGKPINLNLIRDMHSILMKDVRGYDKARGEFRKGQNWIGLAGTPIEQAIYLPPPPAKVIEFMENLESFINSEQKDYLIQVALIHWQFECIHPFVDGNGRIGRILIPIFLYAKGLISNPALYISEFFEKNRQTYYRLLNSITKENNYEDWIKFFLEGVSWQSEKTQKTIDQMLGLYNEIKEKLFSYKSPYTFKMLDFIFYKPIFTTKDATSKLNLNKVTISRLVKIFSKIDILTETERKRNKIFIFKKLLMILQK